MTPQIEAEARPKSALERVIGVFTSPKQTFADIGARPTWVVPIVILIVVQLVFMGLVSQHIGWEKVVTQQMEKDSRTQNMSQEQKDQAIQMGSKFAAGMAYAGVIIGVPVVMALMAGVLMLTMSMVGGKFSFKQSFAIVSHASLIGGIVGILSIIVMFLKAPEDFDIQNPLAFNLGAFMPEGTSKALVSLAGSIDLFSIWSIWLLATGYAAASGKLKFSKALIAVIIPWAVYVLCKTGWVAIRG
jgi:hypothetical protein